MYRAQCISVSNCPTSLSDSLYSDVLCGWSMVRLYLAVARSSSYLSVSQGRKDICDDIEACGTEWNCLRLLWKSPLDVMYVFIVGLDVDEWVVMKRFEEKICKKKKKYGAIILQKHSFDLKK